MGKNFIPENLYKEIISQMPFCCVDLVIKCGGFFLLVKRKEMPEKNKWWLSGGRVLFNESLSHAVRRKLKEEVNIKKVKKIKFLGVGEVKFKKGRFNKPIHTIASVFLVEIDKKEKNNVKVDWTSGQYKWLNVISKNFHPYVRKFLKLANF